MTRVLNFANAGLLVLTGTMNLSFVASQVVLAPATITQPVTLSVGTPASEFTVSVIRTGLVTINVPGSEPSPSLPSSIPTVFLSTPGVASDHQPFTLPAQQAVVTQAPCVSACLQEALIASAAGPCGLSSGTAIDNACACLSAPLVAAKALTNCASAACTGLAAGPAGPALDLVAVTSLYNDYCATAVGAEAFANAVSGGQAFQATAAAGSSITTTAGPDMTTPWSAGASTNLTLANNATVTTNATFGSGATLTSVPTLVDPGVTTGVMPATASTPGTTGLGTTKSEANLELPRQPKRLVRS